MAGAESAPEGIDAAIARVGRAVTGRRLELGLATQRELAEKAGVALNTAAQLERGHTFPRRANAHKLEQALQWPAGTLTALRRGEAAPTVPTHTPSAASPSPGTTSVHAVAIATAVVNIAARCTEILLRHTADEPETAALLRELDAQLLALETTIAASLPHAESFDDTVSALAEVHRHREALKVAAQKAV